MIPTVLNTAGNNSGEKRKKRRKTELVSSTELCKGQPCWSKNVLSLQHLIHTRCQVHVLRVTISDLDHVPLETFFNLLQSGSRFQPFGVIIDIFVNLI